MYKTLDNRILRVNRQIYQEVHSLLLSSPKRFSVCNGLCLESLFLSIEPRDRQWIRHVRVGLYVGDTSSEVLGDETDRMLLQSAESRCGPYVQSALKCQGVGRLLHVTPAGNVDIGPDDKGRRTLIVDLTLK